MFDDLFATIYKKLTDRLLSTITLFYEKKKDSITYIFLHHFL